MKNLSLIFISLLLSVNTMAILSGPVRIGNGDDGEDLQYFEPVTDSKIIESRAQAVKLLNSFSIRTIDGLGALTPEVENTKMYMAQKGLSAGELAKLGAYSDDGSGLVYARTLPVHYAATRFFPAALKLSQEQLIPLHIHEALHRSLPSEINENEEIISSITQAIITPGASKDSIRTVVASYMPKKSTLINGHTANNTASEVYIPKKSRLNNPSRLGIETRHYSEDKDDINNSGIKSMYLISSHLYPFGEGEKAVGLGFDASIVKTDDDSFMGPLGLSARYQLYTKRDFDIEGFAQVNLNTLSDDELKNSRLGRDTTKVGLTFSTRKNNFFIENDFSYTFESESKESVGGVDLTYTYGGITGVNLRAGAYYKKFLVGGFTEILLSENYKLSDGGELNKETGRNRVISWGPSIEYRDTNYSLILNGRFLLDSTNDTSYNTLSDLMGYGVGQGSIQTKLNIFF